MKKIYTLVTLLCPFVGLAQLNYNARHHYVPFEIDGVIEFADNDIQSETFVQHDNGNSGSNTVSAIILWSETGLYLGFDVKDTDILATQTDQDADIYAYDDLVEVFIDPDGDGEDYLEIGVNSYGVYYDYIINCPGTGSCGSWSSDITHDLPNIEVAATYSGTPNNSKDIDEGFQVEIFLPYADLMNIPNGGFSMPTYNDQWNINLFQIDYEPGISTQYLSWNPHNSFGFHQPTKFGTVTFSDVVQSTENEFTETAHVYPNPTEDQLFFASELSYEVVSMQGNSLLQGTSDHVDLNNLQAGIYIIKTDSFIETVIKK